MTQIQPIIEKVIIPEIFPSMAAKDFSHITGTDPGYQARSFYYRDIETGEEYSEILGGFVPPAKKPGFAVVVGIGRLNDVRINPEWKLGTNKISVLMEAEEDNLANLITSCLTLREMFLPAMDRNYWYFDADPELLFRVAKIMTKLFPDEELKQMSFLPMPGLYFGQSSAFRDYAATLNQYKRIISRGKCHKIKAAMDSFPKEAMFQSGLNVWEDFPEVMALAYAVHALVTNPVADDQDVVEDDDF